MKNKTAMQIFCENLEHNMSIETFKFYNMLKSECLELEKQQIIDAYDNGKEQASCSQLCPIDFYNKTYNNGK